MIETENRLQTTQQPFHLKTTQQKSGFTIRIPKPTTPPDITRPTEASKAKTTEKDKANLAIDALWRNALEEEEYTFITNEEDLPKNYEDAIRGDEGEKWKMAMDEEIETLGKMGTWRLPTGYGPRLSCLNIYLLNSKVYSNDLR